MLTSIHPLGERVRHNRWGLTVTAYLVGSLAGGTSLGGLLGLVGSGLAPRMGHSAALLVVAAAAGLGSLFDLGLIRSRLPSPRRQVDENWLNRYRGWVYGVGFGYQLGLGLVTIVTSATVYLTFLLALLAGSPTGGALIGGTFGLVRALPVLTGWGIHRPDQLRGRHGRVQRLGRVARPAAAGLLVALILAPTLPVA